MSLVYTPRDPLEMSMEARLEGPSESHPLGTDQFGRDLLSRIMVGSETSILVGVIAVGIGMGAGVFLGMLSGYFGGWLDETFMRLMDAVQGFPAILSALLITAVFKPSVVISMVAIGVAFLPVFARLTRASFLELRDREFVLAARALGTGDAALIGRHILPNTLAPSSSRRPSASRWPSSPRRRSPISGSAPSRLTRHGGSCSGRRRPFSVSRPGLPSFPAPQSP